MDDASEIELADRMVYAGSLAEAGQWTQAVVILKGILENPALADHGYREWLTAACHLTMGNALDRGDDLEGSVACYRACIEAALDDPEDPDWEHVEAAYSSMAATFRVRNHWAEALFCYQKAYEVAEGAYLLEHIRAMEKQLKSTPAPVVPRGDLAPPGFRRLRTAGQGKPFWCQGSVNDGIRLKFERGSAKFDSADWAKLLKHFEGRTAVPLGASRTVPPPGSLGAYLMEAGTQNLASYLVAVLLDENRTTVTRNGKAILLDFAAPAASAIYAVDIFGGGRLEDCGLVEQVVFQDGELRYLREGGVEVTVQARPTSLVAIDTRHEQPVRFRFFLDGERLITFSRLAT